MRTGLINAPPKMECEWASRHYVNETAVQAGSDRPHCYCCFCLHVQFNGAASRRHTRKCGGGGGSRSPPLRAHCVGKRGTTGFKQGPAAETRNHVRFTAVAVNNTTTSTRRLALRRWDRPKYTGRTLKCKKTTSKAETIG